VTVQDNKSNKSIIFHIFGGKLPVKAIAIKFGIRVGVHEIVTWAKFDV